MTVRISTASGLQAKTRSLRLAVLIQSAFPYMQLQSALVIPSSESYTRFQMSEDC
jgi:hypothetical protein